MIVLRRGLESPIERWVVAEALKRGVRSLKLGHRHDTSWPDRMFFVGYGQILIVEFKKPGGDPEPKQEDRIDELRQLGYQVEVHDDREMALRAITSACERARWNAKHKIKP